jgi:plastocyanin
MQRLVRAASIALLVLAATAVGSPATAADRTVSMRDSRYVPGTVTIRPGDTVTWTNDGVLPHDATGDGWSTVLLGAGQRDSVRFVRAGTYRYGCTIHAGMRGTVVVRAGAAVAPPDTDTVAPSRAGSGGWPVLLIAGVIGWLASARLARDGDRR